MDIEYDNEGNGYIIETYTQKIKVCPLTGQCAYYSEKRMARRHLRQ